MKKSKAYLKTLREKVLSDCRPDWAFWVCNGTIIRNIYELANSIEAMSDYVFRYHVNTDNKKNDFAKWIKEVLGDEDLAKKLEKVMDKKIYVEIIRDRITQLESIK